jgi:hypothetical protein
MSQDARTPLCLTCGYALTGLPEPRCPECGRPFDLANPKSFTFNPPFVGWRYWLPGFLLALITGLISYVILIQLVGFGWTVSLVLPFCLGSIIGFGCRSGYLMQILLALFLIVSCAFGLFFMNIVGVFCGAVLAGIALGPAFLGLIAGTILRQRLKRSRWDQRGHLPLLCLLLTPMIWGAVERAVHRPLADETISTDRLIAVSPDRAWKSLMFYEEVAHPPPLLMRLALPRPLYTSGVARKPGDVMICVYTKGRLVKRVTASVVDQKLTFAVIEQTRLETDSIHLEGGSFAFEPAGSNQTRVTLTSQYQPLLWPRFLWRPFERIGFHTLHGYVLDGMAIKAMSDQSAGDGGPRS